MIELELQKKRRRFYFVSTISVRRFFCLPSGSSDISLRNLQRSRSERNQIKPNCMKLLARAYCADTLSAPPAFAEARQAI
jgi:hypothetical protein